MEPRYYDQLIARQMKSMMISARGNFAIDADFLCGLTKSEFIDGYQTVFELFYTIYEDMYHTPELFDFPLLDFHQYHRFDKKVVALNIFPLFNLIYSLMVSSIVQNNRARIDSNILKEKITFFKISKLSSKLEKLQEYGFVFEGWSKKSNLNNTSSFVMEYPDHPQMLNVLKAASEKTKIVHDNSTKRKLNQSFYLMNYHLFENLTTEVPPYTQIDYKKFVGKKAYNFLTIFHNFMKEKGFQAVWNGLLHISYMRPNGKPHGECYVCFANYKWGIERDNQLLLRIMFHHVTRFQHLVEKAPEHLKEVFVNTHCRHCNVVEGESFDKPCKFRVSYMLDGIKYDECSWEAFYFTDLSVDDFEYIKQFYELEYEKS